MARWRVMKVFRIICLLVVSLLALAPLGSVLAQEPVLISADEYKLTFTPSQERYDTIILAGNDKALAVYVENTGSGTVNNITFSSDEPSGWDIEFDPEQVVALEAGDSKRIDVNLEVPEQTAAGDYMIHLNAAGDEVAAPQVDIRVTVNTGIKEPKIEVRPIYPTLEGIAGEEFVFEVEFQYQAATMISDPVAFNLITTAPQGWDTSITPPYEKEKKLSAISLKPGFTFAEKHRVVVKPPFLPLPEPGEYPVTLEVVDEETGTLSDTIEFTAIITARYALILAPAAERYNTTATAGKDSYFSIQVANLGTADMDKVSFSSTKPSGWTIEFTPDEMETLKALDAQTVDVNIKAPPDTIAGDYQITLRASGTQAMAQDLNVRVTVESPTIWGWVGVIIIVLVIASLVVIFMRFSRR
jgi:uncharacterized membrane protein